MAALGCAGSLLLSLVGCSAVGSNRVADQTDEHVNVVAPPSQPHAGSEKGSLEQEGDANVATPAPSQTPAQQPTSVQLPSGTRVAVDSTATRPDGELAIPVDVRRAGWWDGSSQLGDPFGSVVIAAHVDSFDQGLGHFAELLSVRSGDVMEVDSRSYERWYRVTSAELVPKSSITESASVFSAQGNPRLVLITCGGAYDPAAGGYQDNFVVLAEPVGALRAS